MGRKRIIDIPKGSKMFTLRDEKSGFELCEIEVKFYTVTNRDYNTEQLHTQAYVKIIPKRVLYEDVIMEVG